ncbi:MAG: hypothetical protein COT55_00315 [Candidatus Diapherotrites archaeon CG09_land_8_20_14_0_10_32_12]|nr:MAG: hypothetical protein COT55_00315 [Candidatus Diapherotrites archaeon CG09_land_8_20_14_0_10_32_12]
MLEKILPSDLPLFEQEQRLWKKITETEDLIKRTNNSAKKEKYEKEILVLKEKVKFIQQNNPAKLRHELNTLKEALKENEDQNKNYGIQNKLLKAIINKYLPEQSFGLEDLKKLVLPNDLSVLSIKQEIMPESYDYENDYLVAIKNLYDYLQKNYTITDLNLSNKYWLAPKDIIEASAGDVFDLSILVCSILIALGGNDTKVYVVELSDFSRHAFVLTRHKKRVLIIDLVNSENYNDYLGYEKDIWSEYSPKNLTIRTKRYSFNDVSFDYLE